MSWLSKMRKYWAVAQVAARSKLAYWQEMGARGLFFGVILFIFSQLWGSLLGNGGTLAGFTRQQLVWYLTITEVVTLSSTSLLSQVEQDVKTGQIAYLLLRPASYLLYQAGYYAGEMLVVTGCNLLVGALLALLLVGPLPLSAGNILGALVMLVLGGALRFLLLLAIALLSFFVEECRPFYWIYSKLIFTAGGLFIPLDLYPRFLQALAKALPFQSVAYAPARMFVGGGVVELLPLAATSAVWTIALALLVRWQYGKGVQRVNVHGG
ncbi:MAG: ABC transporter permease [Bacillota bacterium]|jgi:ABC-2 type transport system permease protein